MSKLLSPKGLIYLVAVVVILALFYFSGRIAPPEIAVAAEKVIDIHLFGVNVPVTNTLLATWVTMLLLIGVSYFVTRDIRKKDLQKEPAVALVPASRLQSLVEMLVEMFYDLTEEVAGSWTPQFFPIVMTIFLFVVTSNWLGVLPLYGSVGILEHPHRGEGYVVNWVTEGLGVLTPEKVAPSQEEHSGQEPISEGDLDAPEGDASGQEEHSGQAHDEGQGYVLAPLLRSAATDLNTTLALALISVVLTQYFGIKALGPGYFSKFINFTGFKQNAMVGAIDLFVGILETIGEFAKIISFSFRLFGNVFAGEVLLGVMAFLIPYLVSLPFYGLELFVGFIQALVFMMLTLVFFSMATVGHGPDEH